MLVPASLTGKFLLTSLISMIPVVELRGALPIGIGMGLSPLHALAASVIGNMIPVPFIILLIRRIFAWLRTRPWWEKKISLLEARAHHKGELVRKYRVLGLFILVAIPLPGTGAWTGSLVAALLDIRMKHALPAILLGVIAAGLLVLMISLGVTLVI